VAAADTGENNARLRLPTTGSCHYAWAHWTQTAPTKARMGR
jgi:hypothetical protein